MRGGLYSGGAGSMLSGRLGNARRWVSAELRSV